MGATRKLSHSRLIISFYSFSVLILVSAFSCGHVDGPDQNNASVQESPTSNSSGGNSSANSGSVIVLANSSNTTLVAGNPAVGGFTLNLVTNGQQVAVPSDYLIDISSAQLAVSASAGGSHTPVLAVPAGTDSTTFFVSAPNLGQTVPVSYLITASDPKNVYQSATLIVMVDPAGTTSSSPTSLVFSGPGDMISGTCAPLTVTPKSGAISQPFAVDTAIVLNDTSNHGAYFSNSQCTGIPVTSASILAGAPSQTIYYTNQTLGLATLTATAGGLTGSQALLINPAPAVAVIIAGPPSIPVAPGPGSCALYKVSLIDNFTNPVLFTTAQLISLTGIHSFYADSSCQNQISAVSLPANNAQVGVYVSSGTSGPYTLSPSSGSLQSIPLAITVTGPLADTMTLVSVPAGISSVAAGSCVNLQISLFNPSHQPVTFSSSKPFTLGGGGQGSFYAGSGCGGAATSSLTLGAGQSSMVFSFADPHRENLQLLASTAGIASATYALSIVQGAPSQFYFLPLPQLAIGAGSCTAVTVAFMDAYFNPASFPSGNHSISLTTTNSGNALASCPGIASTVFAVSGESLTFFVSDTVAESFRITASAPLMQTSSLLLTTSPGAPSQFSISAPASTAVGSCSAMATVTAKDQFGNPTPFSSISTLTLTTINVNNSGDFAEEFSGGGCGAALTNDHLTIAAQSSTASFSFRATLAGTYQISAQGGSIVGTKSVLVH